MNQDHILGNKTYDVTKYVAQIVLPALGTLYFALAGFWDFPKPNEVVGTIVAVDTFLGVLLGISTSSYNKSDSKYDGEVHLDPDSGEMNKFVLNTSPQALAQSKDFMLKVKKSKEDPEPSPEPTS